MINKIILSPPFSNIYPNIQGTTRITGTYTLKKRRGMHRILTTLRKTESGWINNVGLRNPGIKKLNKNNSIISVALKDKSEWHEILDILVFKKEKYNILGLEFNISCPNSKTSNITHKIISEAKKEFNNISIKVPHNLNYISIDDICNSEANFIHISNTKPHPKGSLSGKKLIEKNSRTIYYIRNNFKYMNIIAGGGIYSYKDYIIYKNSGANYFSLSTLLVNPFKANKIIKKLS